MNVFVAGLAKRNAVGDIIAQIGMMLPRLNVVGLYLAGCAALLAGAVVTGKNSIAPLAVPVGVALLVAVWFARSQGLAMARAVFHSEMAVCRRELHATPLARKHLPDAAASRQYSRARCRAGGDVFRITESSLESLAAYLASCFVAVWTVLLAWVGRFKHLATDSAGNCTDGDGWLAVVPIGMLAAELRLALDLLGAARIGAKFACGHISIIPLVAQFAKLQRWADATGRTPVNLE